MSYEFSPDLLGEPTRCGCWEAQAWREYWSEDAIRDRLAHELDLYREICHQRWGDVARDTKADGARIKLDPGAPTHAEMARRRAE